MKLSILFPIAAACVLISCEKPLSEEERKAQVEQEVQQRLAAERQADEQQRLDQQQADITAREQALADKEATSTAQVAGKQATATPRASLRPASGARLSSSDGSPARSYDTFYRKLEPYGAWRETNDYGYVWQPRQAQSRDWRPYTDGRWAYTDAGWTWVSDEPFGWATYHYGRWTRLSGVGWVWVPGEEWAPAWVSWRKSDEHVGWAPLPPEARFERGTGIKKWADSYYDIDAGEYVFIPKEDIGDENVRRAVVPQERNVTIVNESTNVTNITYNNTTIVNEGPDYNELRAQSRQPFERKRLARRFDVDEDQAPQADVRGETIAMLTPLFTARAVERPRNVGAPIRQATVERPTTNQPDAERIRAKMRAEATPPPDAPSKKFEKPQLVESAGTAAPVPGGTAAQAAPAPATPVETPSPTASPAPRIVPSATTATPTATPQLSPTATATPRVVATPTATPSAAPSATSTATITPNSMPTSTPRRAPSPLPVATAAPSATATVVPAATAIPAESTSPAASPAASADTGSASGRGPRGT
ncbi:MAG: hypothetical protein M3Q89_09365, partial [Verrucomicrobiota bacterium]|nr:hypothetical protein [Verrucomicrobiota bacterium]